MIKIAKYIGIISTIALIAADKAPKSPSEIAQAAPLAAWSQIDADNIVIFTLKDGKQFTIELADKLSPIHVNNIKKLVRAGWFEKTSIVRVQDNYVVQWGAPENTKLPDGINLKPQEEYEFLKPKNFVALPFKDTFAAQTGYVNSWPVATDGKKAWPVHCYGAIGVGRDMAPDTGTGQELYTVIGQSPRHLDRNINISGRILSGMENLTAQSRGTGTMGFYEKEEEKQPIISAKIASDLPEALRPKYQVLRADTKTFQEWLHAKANRGAPFFIKPAGAVDICNALLPIRKQ